VRCGANGAKTAARARFRNYTSSHFFPDGETHFVCADGAEQGALDVPLSCCKSHLRAGGLDLDCAANVFGMACGNLSSAGDVESRIHTNVRRGRVLRPVLRVKWAAQGCRVQLSGLAQPFLLAAWLFLAAGLLQCCVGGALVLLWRDAAGGGERRLLPHVDDLHKVGMGNDTIRVLAKAAQDTGLPGTSQISVVPESKTVSVSHPTEPAKQRA